MSGACSVSRPVAGAVPLWARSPVSRFGPTASSKPFSERSSPFDGDVAGELHDQRVEPAAAREAAGDVGAVHLAVEADAGVGRARGPSACPAGSRRRPTTVIGWPSPWAWPEAVSAPPRRGSTSARSVRPASKPMSVWWLEIWPLEAKVSCGLAILRFSVRMPASSRTARPDSVVRAGEQRVEAGVADGEVVGAAVEGQVEAAAERGDAAGGAQVDRTGERPVREAGEDRDVGDMDGAGGRCRRASAISPAVKTERPLPLSWSWLIRIGRVRRQRGVGEDVEAGAERLRDLGVGGPDAGGEALDVDGDVALRGVLEVSARGRRAAGSRPPSRCRRPAAGRGRRSRSSGCRCRSRRAARPSAGWCARPAPAAAPRGRRDRRASRSARAGAGSRRCRSRGRR